MDKFYKLCRRYPPILVRLLARDNGQAMPYYQIASRAHLSELDVFVLSEQRSWDNIPLGRLRDFTRACHLDFTSRADVNRVECYLHRNGNKPPFRYLVKSGYWQNYYLPLLVAWRKTMTTPSPDLPIPIQNLLKTL